MRLQSSYTNKFFPAQKKKERNAWERKSLSFGLEIIHPCLVELSFFHGGRKMTSKKMIETVLSQSETELIEIDKA